MTQAVLIHGCHLGADAWEHIVLGTRNALGRVPIGIRYAVQHNARLIFWGTGASERGGVKESRITFKLACDHIEMLADLVGMREHDLLVWLKQVSIIDTETQNTTQEVARCMDLCLDRGIDHLTLVSSPTHIQRCMTIACAAVENEKYASLRGGIMALPSMTCYADTHPSDVVCIEPPHRGDTPRPPVHLAPHVLGKKIFSLMRDPKYFQFLQEFEELLNRYGA